MDLAGTLAGIEQEAARTIGESETDYIGADGLLICGKCHTKKQFRGVFLGVEKIVPSLCKCRAEELEKEREAENRKKAMRLAAELRRTGMQESDLQNWTFANSDNENPRLMQAAKNYVEHFDEMKRAGKGLLLYGDCGTGKTYAAACIVNALIDRGIPCLMTNFSRVLNTLWSIEKKQEYIDAFNQYSLLVLDDLGAERQSEYVAEQVFNVIDSRCRAKLPMIVTTNLTLRELTAPEKNKRIYDRLLGRCHPIEVNGESRRRKQLKDDLSDMNKLLGL